MVSFRTTLLALASAIVVSGDYYVTPDSVSLPLRSKADALIHCRRNED